MEFCLLDFYLGELVDPFGGRFLPAISFQKQVLAH